MRLYMIPLALLLIMVAGAVADEVACPADRAALAGFEAFGEFHHAMAQAWHVDWPDSNYQALLAAGPEFSRLFKPIAILKPVFKSDARRDAFLEHRRGFGQIVKDFNAACSANDSAAVYAMMPGLHDAFEAAAGDLLPIPYPEFDGLVITINLIAESHLPNKNMKGLIGSTETLVAKAGSLSVEAIPAELAQYKLDILGIHNELRSKAAKLSRHLAEDNLVEYEKTLKLLQEQVADFVDMHL
ncbi:MAG: hypothetical protein ABIE70_05810 [bacterium]